MHVLKIGILSNSYEITLIRIPQDPFGNKLTYTGLDTGHGAVKQQAIAITKCWPSSIYGIKLCYP